MDVSVVIPTHDRPEFLKEALDCVLSQTVPPREIIVVDNGAKEETCRMLKGSYGSSVVYVRELRHGVQAARNAGIARARGAWVATLDDDDLPHPQFLEQFRPVINDGRANITFSD